ncbi:hypothetical protein GEM49_01405 [Salmonella enterica]|uniref:MarR family transcriptional regulator n=1 Tax=Salmonella enterica TaxID=28901 RepID=A0A403EXT7_SALER|nr:hypothetical protein [Salmonella enterica]EBH8098152.1 hypothetical protein [Salmonella enterica subsp. houtenae serovar O:11:g,z25:-]ECJ5920798.1 hypothetical protein [Salmonella enterica subsp. houtenae]HAE4737024.1 hypothetical protein [Salmonella enterica subsp. houtenae serovar 41:z4,z23:-]EAY4742172.1 hypothetical protein [Salmonella enterica]
MIKLNKVERTILKHIYTASNSTISSFSLFKKMKLEIPVFFTSLKALEKIGFISYDSEQIILLPNGINFIATNTISEKQPEKKWNVIPDYFLTDKESTTGMYIPSRKLLSKKTFNV